MAYNPKLEKEIEVGGVKYFAEYTISASNLTGTEETGNFAGNRRVLVDNGDGLMVWARVIEEL